jgi:hypothetical protein
MNDQAPVPRRRTRDLARSAPISGHPYDVTESKTSDDISRYISERGNEAAHFIQDIASVRLQNAANPKAPMALRSLIYNAKNEATDALRAAFTVGEPMVDLRPTGDTTTDVAVLVMLSILNDRGEGDRGALFADQRREKMGAVAHVAYALAAFDAFFDELVHSFVDLFVWVLGDGYAAEYLPKALENKILIYRSQFRSELRSWGLPA